jgi:hypothetical protein
MTRIKAPNIILFIGLSVLLAGAAWSGYRLQELSSARKQLKEDYSLSNSVTFGLFSVDEWRDRLSEVISHQVNSFHITPEQKKDIQEAVEKELHSLVSKTLKQLNKPQKSLGGKLKKLAVGALVDSGALQDQVRPFARTIVAKVSSPESEDRLKSIATSKIRQLEKETFDSTSMASYAVMKYLYHQYKVPGPNTFNQKIQAQLAANQHLMFTYLLSLFACVIAALLLWWAMHKTLQLQTVAFVFALLFALVLLLVGAATSVIEVDARIQSMDLVLLGEKVQFTNQVLFFQSKSILGIVTTLISQQKPDAVVVGVLIFLFVVLLPLIRIIAKGIHILSPKKVAQHPVVRYLTFETAKWDMADVLIVGMLMTYIGLNGILKSQLSSLNIHSGSLNVITSNGTSIQPGYFIFVAYVLFATLLSYILKRISPQQH